MNYYTIEEYTTMASEVMEATGASLEEAVYALGRNDYNVSEAVTDLSWQK